MEIRGKFFQTLILKYFVFSDSGSVGVEGNIIGYKTFACVLKRGCQLF